MTADKTMLNFRCPNDLLDLIDTLGRERHPQDNKNGCDRSKTLMDIIEAGIQALSNGTVEVPIRKTESNTESPTESKTNRQTGSKTISTAQVEAIVETRLTSALDVLQARLDAFEQRLGKLKAR